MRSDALAADLPHILTRSASPMCESVTKVSKQKEASSRLCDSHSLSSPSDLSITSALELDYGRRRMEATKSRIMSLRELRYLIALADCLSFTRAAERCAVTQSTLSIQLRKLEDYLGVQLFERNRAHVALTAEGKQLVRFARISVRAADRMVALSRAQQANTNKVLKRSY